ncbi:pentatricopeptide repeat-containing protein 2, mitochondrial-like [Topomyia yanbarensis]|uniref:pentatricopeptide repeat-containing protein 2, mitochondrial-like n=1 Tax=Topomyia yanbarensis TaxID=2498891 RepID=UPI00273AAAF2|nr:pentatricopeptide repeat-containing protein 2, mitochondrial-like [Topomyia yanbarensis]
MLRKSLLTLVRQSECANIVNTRSLYSASVLGLDGYQNYREKTKTQHMHNVDSFKRKMREFVDGSATNMIFTEDLKNIVHLVENTPEDKKLLLDMIDKYNSQGQELRFGNYIFGPVVMRALYFMKDPQLALQLIKDEKYNGFFDQFASYQVLGDLLYEHGLYPQVRELFDLIKARQVQSGRYPKHSITLAFAACYKENSQESFQYAMSLWKELNAVGHLPMRKATAFAAALALNHNQPGIALEIIATLTRGNYVTIRQIKVLALTALGRLEDLLPIFRTVLEIGGPLEKKQTFCREVVQQLKDTLAASESETLQDLQRMLEYLTKNGHITDSTLDELLCQEIVTSAPRRDTYNNLAESYHTRGGTQQFRSFAPNRTQRERFSRPGLSDMN